MSLEQHVTQRMRATHGAARRAQNEIRDTDWQSGMLRMRQMSAYFSLFPMNYFT